MAKIPYTPTSWWAPLVLVAAGCARVECDLVPAEGHAAPILEVSGPRAVAVQAHLEVDGIAWATPVVGGHEVRLPLLGIPLGRTAAVSVAVDGRARACSLSVDAAELPEDARVPRTAVAEASAMSAERYLVGATMGEAPAAYVWDRSAEALVYYRVLPPSVQVPGVQRDPWSGDLMWPEYPDVGSGQLAAESMTGHPRTPRALGGGHHDIELLPGGGVAFLAVDVAPWYDPERGETLDVVADRIVVLTPGEEGETVFSIWDDYPELPVDSRGLNEAEAGYAWTHANGLDWDEHTGTMWMSLGFIDSLLQVDLQGPTVVRQLGGPGGIPVPGTLGFPHDPNGTGPDTVLVSRTVDGTTYASELRIDDEAGTVEEIWGCGRALGIEQPPLGMAKRLANGNTLIGWGLAGVLVEVTPDCTVVWRLDAGEGSWFGNGHLVEGLYAP